MRLLRIAPFTAALFSIVLSATYADPERKVDFAALDGVPVGGSEDAVLTAFDKFPKPTPTPTRESRGSAFGAMNNRPRRPFVGLTPDPYAGLTPTQIRGVSLYGAQRTQCPAMQRNSGAFATYDVSAGAQDGDRFIGAKFTLVDSLQSCETIATTIFSSQLIVGSTIEAHEAAEDQFVAAAKAKFGTPTYFEPRHVGTVVNGHGTENALGAFNNIIGAGNNAPVAPTTQKGVIAPSVAWCDTGTVSDCKRDGPTVNRRLLLRFSNYDGDETAIVDLDDLQAQRRIAANAKKSSLQRNKPQL